MESSGSSSGHPNLPPGFRFHPTDEELVVHYLQRKANSIPLPVTIIAEIDLYKFDPWELPSKASFGEQEWYFFSPRDRKYPNGARPNRAATSGYWKATGTDKPILTSNGTHKVGVKKALVFYGGKPPRGIKTNWIMHEYRLVESACSSSKLPDNTSNSSSNKKASLRLDDWVLCRIYKKNNSQAARLMMESDKEDSNMDSHHNNHMLCSADHDNIIGNVPKLPLQKPGNYAALLENDETFLHGMVSSGTSDDLHQQQGGLKRQNSSAFWTGDAKRFQGVMINDSSFVSMLSQIPQSSGTTTSFHANSVLLGSSQFQLPTDMNWNS